MAKSSAEQFIKIQSRLAETLRTLPAIVGEEAVNFSLESFDQQAWSGDRQEPWKKRKNPTKWGKPDETDRALLIKTGALRRSIRITRLDENTVFVGAGGKDIPYAKAHNYGFRGTVKQNVRAFTRKMKNGKIQQVKAHDRVINQNLPQRRFIGGADKSPYLRARIRRIQIAELRKIFR